MSPSGVQVLLHPVLLPLERAAPHVRARAAEEAPGGGEDSQWADGSQSAGATRPGEVPEGGGIWRGLQLRCALIGCSRIYCLRNVSLLFRKFIYL